MNERNWGGVRPGAGRKKGDVVYKNVTIALPEDEAQILLSAAKDSGMTVSRFVSKYLGLERTAKKQRTAKSVQGEK